MVKNNYYYKKTSFNQNYNKILEHDWLSPAQLKHL